MHAAIFTLGVFLSVDKKPMILGNLGGAQGSACRQPTMPHCGSSLAPHGAFGVGCFGFYFSASKFSSYPQDFLRLRLIK
jgi:uncharacterized membrane protein YjjB (DUF3815 family)